jgi:hypothetical protein
MRILHKMTEVKDRFWLGMSIGKKWQRGDRKDRNNEAIDGQFPISKVRKHK